ncbi:T9SS type A sorting domain-containing protein [Vicingus serpentipes]|uniref:T9SS type A sorting domain-containing protein n=1 Tax=Vicingus serpentipes TaxID=1926625 RepID=A0A5C6RR89_9FLAO|nr:M43 family zinc metalloprotease [Vicingus serpentipes]TXB64788.1 T9SS type A sorting domain-containing protein [Vicingus serpentipes]
MKKITLSSILAFATLFAVAQNGIPGVDYRSCSAAEKNNEIMDNNPEIRASWEQANAWALEYEKTHPTDVTIDPVTGKKTILYVMPVVWHVIHNDGPENISKATIDNEILKLNQDYQLLNPDAGNVHAAFASIQADVQVEFRLARLDPDGNCTEGITRTKNVATYAMNENSKFINGARSWNRNGRYYLNIWMGSSIESGAGGYAFYPGNVPMNQDGIVLRAGQLGNTVTHEVGHWLNLPHMWGSTNEPGLSTNCSSDDGISDTPNTIGSTGCAEGTVSCGSVDNSQNYMDYNFCDVMFTNGQKSRMHAALNSNTGFRATMVSAGNRALTGTDDPYVQNPVCGLLGADFTYNKEYICEGDVVSFADQGTYNGTPDQWDWTFTGGTPNASSVASPAITYNSQGVYGVTYSPGNGAGFATPAVKNNIITVSSITADYVLPFAEGFENNTSFINEWTIETESGNGWQTSTSASFTGNRSLRVYNFNNSAGDITEAISPSYDLSTMTDPKLTYKWAFAKKLTGGNDQFIIYKSTDCGGTWSILAIKAGTSMATASATNSAFTPSAADWDSATVSLSALAAETNVRFKLYFKNNAGNNFFLDDLNIMGTSSTVGINEVAPVNNLKVFPNPMTENATLSFFLKNNVSNLNVVIRDVLGQEVTKVVSNTGFSAGKYTMNIDKSNKLSSGLYFIEFNADNNVQVEKLIVK